MTAALISQGPSAALYPAPEGQRAREYDLVIGINWVPTRWPCDWWVFVDLPMWTQGINWFDGQTLRIATHPDYFETMRNQAPGHKIVLAELVALRFLTPPTQALFGRSTGTDALALAWTLGIRDLDVYGVDLCGTADFRGDGAGCSRTPDRWKVERMVWNRTVADLERAGMRIRRAQ
jgi:hypothetical protein